MKGQKLGYVRVSTLDQKADRQLEGIELDRVFVDKASDLIPKNGSPFKRNLYKFCSS